MKNQKSLIILLSLSFFTLSCSEDSVSDEFDNANGNVQEKLIESISLCSTFLISITVASVLKERYSAIEECKADIVGLWNISIMHDLGLIDELYVKKTKATYVAGLYRSIRFGAEKAHGKGNLIQLNFLMDKGAIITNEDGTLGINDDIFFQVVGELAGKILTIQAEGDYEAAGNLFKDYGNVTERIETNIEKLKNIPRDLDTSYEF